MPGSTLTDIVSAASLDALAVLLPVACAGCGRPDRGVCRDCRVALAGAVETHRLTSGLEVTAALRYEGRVRRCILALKEDGRTDLVRPLATPLAAAVGEALERWSATHDRAGGIRLCPLPQGPSSQRRRGFDPVRALLARATGRRVERMLQRDGSGTAQKLLGVDERRANIAGTLRSRRALDGVRVLLVDDVVTTGATLDEAARAVRAAGGDVIGAAVLAATPRRAGAGRASS